MENLYSAAAGAAGVLTVYFLYLAATKGLPAAWAWLKANLSVSALRADLAALESGAVAAVKADVAVVKADVGLLKAHVFAVAPTAPAPTVTTTA